MNLENTKVYTTDPEVIRKYAELCGKELSNGISVLRGGTKIGVANPAKEWTDHKFVTYFSTSAVCHSSIKFTTLTESVVLSMYRDKFSNDCNEKVIRQSESEVEWKNGDECEYISSEDDWCKARYVAYDYGLNFHVIDAGDGLYHANDDDLGKPETESERKECDRLEAAYDLYRKCSGDKVMYVFDDFVGLGLSEMWLTIVDKTNYRKEQN